MFFLYFLLISTHFYFLLISKTTYILVIIETLHRCHDTFARITDTSHPGYAFHHRPRLDGRCGSVGFLISKLFKVYLPTSVDYSSFDSICVGISNSWFFVYFICIDRIYPKNTVNFFPDVDNILENFATLLLIALPFYCNRHLVTPSANTITFNGILSSIDTNQYVTFPTNVHDLWVDILIAHSSGKTIQTPSVSDGVSHDDTVIIVLNIPITLDVLKHNVFYRATHIINNTSLMTDILTSYIVPHPI